MPIDPFTLKRYSKAHPYRLGWSAWAKMYQASSRITYKPISSLTQSSATKHVLMGRGEAQNDTAVTKTQAELLQFAIEQTNHFTLPIVEIGAYRGVTTVLLAQNSPHRQVIAVDPYEGYGGSETDYELFQQRMGSMPNIRHVRATSGNAFKELQSLSISFVFIDAVHDFVNSWFDFWTWSQLVVPGGLIAMHDVDDFPGVNLSLRRILSKGNSFSLWAYCPNLAILRKNS